jgi:precorrin-3B synthase
VRIPGGRIGSNILLDLTGLGGTLQLTSRGNVQLRGVAEAGLPDLTDQVAALGLLPSASHELVRNIVASPLTGLSADRPDLRQMISELDAAICNAPELADLPGRFLFALDDGRADVWSVDFDIGYLALNHAEGLLAVGNNHGGGRRGRPVRRVEAPAEMVGVAADFVRARRHEPGIGWRIWDLDEPRPELRDPPSAVWANRSDPRTPLGIVGRAICAGVPLGFLTSSQAAAISAAASGGPVVITPWRSIVIPDAVGSLPALAATGLVLEAASPWSKITACVGSPGCAKSLIDTRAVAADLARRSPNRPLHISGCERRCGVPAIAHDELVGR